MGSTVVVDAPEKIGSLAVQTITGSVVASISGNIVIGSVTATVDSIYIQSGANITGSSWVYQKTDPWVVSGNVMTSGVVTNFGDLGSSRVVTNLYAGSDSWVKEVPKTEVYVSGTLHIGSISANVDSVYIQSGANMLGSVGVTNFNALGSNRVITNFGDLGSNRVTTNFGTLGSSRVVTNFGTLGSNRVVTNFGDLGSTVVIDAPETIGSLAVQTISGMTNLGSAWGGTGSVHIVNDLSVDAGSVVVILSGTQNVTIGSYTTQGVTQTTSPWVTSGTSTVAGSIFTTGSINIATKLSSIGSYTTQALGSQAITNFEVLGSSRVVTNFGDVGSSRVVTNLYPGSKVWQGERFGVSGTIEVSNRVAGSIVNMPGIVGSIAITNIGSVIQHTSPWVMSGTSTVAGSVYSTGSINIATALSTIGSYTAQALGSSAITNFGLLGSSRVTTNFGVLGSSRVIEQVIPTDASKNNGVGSLVYSAALLGSIVKNIGGTEYVKVLSYSGTNLVGIGSWVAL